jgi:regulator of replication initiation timing
MRFTISTIMLLVACIIVLLLRDCSHSEDKTRLLESVMQYSDSVTYLRSKTGKEIAENSVLLLENERQLKSLISSNKELIQQLDKLKKIKSVTIVKTTTVIKKDSFAYQEPIPCEFEPIKIERDSSNYYFSATITDKIFSIDSLAIPNQQSIIVASTKNGLFKPKKQVIQIINSNDLVKVTGAQSFIVEQKKKWYETSAAKVIFGAALFGLLTAF